MVLLQINMTTAKDPELSNQLKAASEQIHKISQMRKTKNVGQ